MPEALTGMHALMVRMHAMHVAAARRVPYIVS